ncbi:arylesterase [Polaribacter reichenbachii]|uniref:Arylesterase n=1 Tax=Polaribacter reichenbachii TaxID=996801 RepID=A0A1B8U4C9_9FLAO|nr:arylesterase [Polaribacter reichenbachii]APZ47480.1 arylesterase [Polaribacter reichenbachii]AUC18119.1 arylesterase [Polaribacter reichenbachii]OBY66730.1 arylesterase [Polaribacter reichenbachii]
MLKLKNNHLLKNSNNQSRTIFLKFCYFSLALLLFSCKSDAPKSDNTSKTIETETKTTVVATTSKRVVFFGDSLTAGYGLDDVENAFPGFIQQKIDSLGLKYIVVNSGISGETTSGGKNRIDWVLNQKPDVFILELGANDGLRGVNLSETKNNLQFIVDAVKTKYPDTKIVLAGMQIPPNMGQDYTSEFKNIFPDLAKKNNLTLVPFLLENVGGIPSLNQSDGIHPTKEGHKILASNVWEVLLPVLK